MRSRSLIFRTRNLAGLLTLCLVAATMWLGMPASAFNPPRAVATKTSTLQDTQKSEQPEFVTNNYRQTNLVSDLPGLAQLQDPLLVNPWGVAFTPTSPFWAANNGSSVATLYGGDVGGSPFFKNVLNVNIAGGLPTGVVFNGGADFIITSGGTGPARFIFSSITGNINAWRAGTSSIIVVSQPGHVYTGLAIGNNGTANFIYAADFAHNKIDVFDKNFAAATLSGSFTDPALPSGFATYNIQNLGGKLYVTYAKVNTTTGRDDPGAGNGFMSVFDTNGVFQGRLISNGPLNSPWGITVAPAGFGAFPNALLVGNFGDGRVNAFNLTTGAFLGTLSDELGSPISLPGLWALNFGNGFGLGDTGTLYFSSGYDTEHHGLFGSLTPSSPATTQVQFNQPLLSVNENGISINVGLTRSGDLSAAAVVHYATYDSNAPLATPLPGQASQQSDYEISLGTVTFNPGQAVRSIPVFIVDDALVEGPEVFNVAILNPNGTAIGSPSVCKIIINDNDSVTPTTNPIDDSTFFVRQHYLDFLNREPDTNFWVNNIESCGSDANCRTVKRIDTSAAFFLSIEFQKTGLVSYLSSKAAFGLPPFYGRFELDTQALQRNLVFGTPSFDTTLETNKTNYFNDLATRPEFLTKYPASQNGSDFIDAVIATVQAGSGVNLTPRRPDLVNEYLSGASQAQSRARVIRKVTEYPEYIAAEFNAAFVTMEYFGYLRRDPDTAGFTFWLNKLNSFGGDYRAAEMVKAFISSSEYRQRFGLS
jgi:uncharacterized protein (TIGR03118 family)